MKHLEKINDIPKKFIKSCYNDELKNIKHSDKGFDKESFDSEFKTHLLCHLIDLQKNNLEEIEFWYYDGAKQESVIKLWQTLIELKGLS